MNSVEQRSGVVRARSGLGMVLNGEDRQPLVAETFDGPSFRFTWVTSRSGAPGMRADHLVAETANPWFCDVISTRPVSSSFTG